MHRCFRPAAVVLMVGFAGMALADRYVAQAGQKPLSPYDAWANASSNIQAAVSAATAGETVWVSNGLYRATSGNVVMIDKSLSLRSVVTNTAAVIDGEGVRRGISITPAASAYVLIDGFTVTNGYQLNSDGAGINITSTFDGTGVVQNCVMVRNRVVLTAAPSGGGLCARFTAGVDFLTVVSDCAVTHNYAGTSGGGLYFEYGRFLVENTRIAGNVVDVWDPFADPPVAAVNNRGAGGITTYHPGRGSVIRNCVIENNRTSTWGGGILSRFDGELLIENCVIRSNIAPRGAGILIAQHSGMPTNILRNCLISHNWAFTNALKNVGQGGGIMIGDDTLQVGRNVRVENCTVVDNEAVSYGAGARIYTANGLAAVNSIFYRNDANGNANSNYYGTASWTNCLVGTGNVLPGSANLPSQDPAFVDAANGDYRLTRASPCVDAGYYLSWMDGARDLAGAPRIHFATGQVDLGCYEFPMPGSVLLVR